MIRSPLGPAEVVFTGRADGDVGSAAERGPDGPSAMCLSRRRRVTDRPWSWLRQVHGSRVVVVDRPGGGAGEEADALVSASPGVALAVLTADCAPVALASTEGVVGVAHAGWRGLVSGVIEAAVASMRDLGATTITAALGPCIGPECYEFSPADLDAVVARLGDAVRATTAGGRPALDVPAAVRGELARLGIDLGVDHARCTACDGGGWYSHRARGDEERQATVVLAP